MHMSAGCTSSAPSYEDRLQTNAVRQGFYCVLTCAYSGYVHRCCLWSLEPCVAGAVPLDKPELLQRLLGPSWRLIMNLFCWLESLEVDKVVEVPFGAPVCASTPRDASCGLI
jgi:hypothetical protein